MSTYIYDDYVWRLKAEPLSLDIQLPKDLEWVDELSWSPISQNISFSLSGALVVEESEQLKGRPITLQGKDQTGWISREVVDNLIKMKDYPGLAMQLSFAHYNIDTEQYGAVKLNYDVMFRHYDPPVLDLSNILGFGNFEAGALFSVRNLKFMEATPGASSPCSANVTLNITILSGTISVGESITGAQSEAFGTVVKYTDPLLYVYTTDGSFISGETIIGPNGTAIIN